jgi:hypothetical protein
MTPTPENGDRSQSSDTQAWSPFDHVPKVSSDPLPPEDMAAVRFGRSKVLKTLAGATFGFAISAAIKASPALATCYLSSYFSPPCTTQYHRCCCCNDWVGCCNPNCQQYQSGCGSSGTGWYVCYQHNYYWCGDYWQNSFPPCTCAVILAPC